MDVAKGEKRALSGADAFALHDTFGFPIDLTLEMAGEAGVAVDEKAFRELMAEQRQRAQEDARAKKGAMADLSELRRMLDDHGSEFTGYTELVTPTTVRAILSGGVSVPAASEGEHVEIVLERPRSTPRPVARPRTWAPSTPRTGCA